MTSQIKKQYNIQNNIQIPVPSTSKMYPIRTFSTIKTGLPQDIDTMLTANLFRMKTSQLIVASAQTGTIQIYKITTQQSASDLILTHETNQPILGISVGMFTTSHNTLDESERLELAVIHPNSIEILQPKKSQNNTIELTQQSTQSIPKIANFTTAHRATTQLDANKNKRTFISSYLILKTLSADLIITQRKILSKLKLSFRYSIPSQITYNPLSDQLIISTFEYSVLAISFSDLLQQQENALQNAQTETLKILWEVTFGDRIQQLRSGRFFRSDSTKNGEICVVLTRKIVFIDSSGGLVREMDFDGEILKICEIWSGQSGKFSEILSFLVLLKHAVWVVQCGVVKWKGKLELELVEGEGKDECFGGEIGKEEAVEEEFKGVSKPLRAVQKKVFLNKISYQICISTPFSISQQFHASNKINQPLVNEKPGYFALANAEGNVRICYFGTTNSNFQRFQPIQLPSSQISKQIKDELQKELSNVVKENDESLDQKLEVKIIQVQPVSDGVETEIQIEFESSVNVIDLRIMVASLQEAVSVCFEGQNVYYVESLRSFKRLQTKCVVKFLRGNFVSSSQLGIIVSCCNQENRQRLSTSLMVPLPLLSFNVFGAIPVQKQKFSVQMQFEKPFSSLGGFLQQKPFSEHILADLTDKCLGVKNLDGALCCIQSVNNSSLEVSSDRIEQLFVGIDFLLSYEQNYMFNYDQNIIIQAIIELKKQSNQVNNVKVEDKLAGVLGLFQEANQLVSEQLHATYSKNVCLNKMKGNIGQNLEVLTDYIECMCSQVQEGTSQNDSFIERLRGAANLLCDLKFKQVDMIQQKRILMGNFADVEGFDGIYGKKLDKFLD